MRVITTLIFSLFIIANAQASGKKQPAVAITFHTEATNLQSKKLSFEIETPKGKSFMSKTPFITTNDIVAYKAFPSPHNPEMYGVSFQLNRAGVSRLKMTSGQYVGKWIMCSINGKVVDMLYIDRQIDGRVITIWRGVDQAMLNACNHLIPRIGEERKAWKTRLKYEKKQ